MSPWFFTNDLHGQGAFYEQLLAIVAARRPRAVIIGGDLAPHATGVEGVRRQRLFLEGLLVEFARRLRDASPTSELLLMMGNDDWAANEDVLERHDGGLWHSLHERVVEVDGVAVAGCSWVPITPFGIKDWERWEDGGEESPPRLDGWTSRGGRLAPMRFDPAHRAPSIAGSLRELAARTAAGEAVWVSHGPPRDTRCDVLSGGAHVGSRALRRFVEEHQPPLLLSGHIHESARVSGSYHDRIGRTVVVNPGQFGTARLCGVWFDPRRVAETLAHTVHR
jgi:Icc-related predicted phosphoesterase